jgi:hypothetical protein
MAIYLFTKEHEQRVKDAIAKQQVQYGRNLNPKEIRRIQEKMEAIFDMEHFPNVEDIQQQNKSEEEIKTFFWEEKHSYTRR